MLAHSPVRPGLLPCLALLLAPAALSGCALIEEDVYSVDVILETKVDNAVPAEEAEVTVRVGASVRDPVCFDGPFGDGSCRKSVTPTDVQVGPVGSAEPVELDQGFDTIIGYYGREYEFSVVVDGRTMHHVQRIPGYQVLSLEPALPRAGEPLTVAWEPHFEPGVIVYGSLGPILGNTTDHAIYMDADPGFVEIPRRAMAAPGKYHLELFRYVEVPAKDGGVQWHVTAKVGKTLDFMVE